MTRSLSLLCLVASVVGTSAHVSADVVEPGFVETCTLEQVQRAHPGETCVACDTYYAEATRCDTELSEGGYTQACRSRGASTWVQIGCRVGAAPSPAPSPAPAVTPTPSPAPAPVPARPTPTPAATPNNEPTPTPATTPSNEPSSSRCSIGYATSVPWHTMLGVCVLVLVLVRRRPSVPRRGIRETGSLI